MDWLAHDRLGFNYRLSDLAAAMGVAQLERADALLAARAASRRCTASAWAASRASSCRAADRGAERRSWFVYVVQLPEGVDRDGVIGRSASAGIASKAYLPCIHLQPFYRERFGFRGGEFPVAERVAARSLALPFFTRDDRGAGRAGVRGAARVLAASSRRSARAL